MCVYVFSAVAVVVVKRSPGEGEREPGQDGRRAAAPAAASSSCKKSSSRVCHHMQLPEEREREGGVLLPVDLRCYTRPGTTLIILHKNYPNLWLLCDLFSFRRQGYFALCSRRGRRGGRRRGNRVCERSGECKRQSSSFPSLLLSVLLSVICCVFLSLPPLSLSSPSTQRSQSQKLGRK